MARWSSYWSPVSPQEVLRSLDWPRLQPVDEVILQPGGCLVLAAGFEDRALAAIGSASDVCKEFSVVLIRYLPELVENREDEVIALCRKHSLDVHEVVYDRRCPSGIGLSVLDVVSKFQDIVIDVSAMSRLLLVQLIVSVLEARLEFEVIYTEANVYPPSKSDYVGALTSGSISPSFLSSGVFEVVSTPELSSTAMLGGSIRLISFPSFDHSQLANLVQEVQPSQNDVVNGVPPRQDMAWRRRAIRDLNRSTLKSIQRSTMFDASTLDYRETLTLILAIYEQHSAFDRIVIAPTGSKMQSVAVALARGVLGDIQICYPTPMRFVDPSRYTEGVRQTYSLRVSEVGQMSMSVYSMFSSR